MAFTINTRKPGILDYLLITLACMNIGAKGSVVLLSCTLLGVIRFSRLQVCTDLLCYCMMSLVAATLSVFFYPLEDLIKSLLFFLSYAYGNGMYLHAKNKSFALFRLVFAVFFGFFLFLALTYFYNLDIATNSTHRLIYSIWTHQKVSATLIGLICSVVIGLSCWAFFFAKNKYLIVLSLTSLFFVFAVNLKTATRTPFIMGALVFFIVFLHWLFSTRTVRKSFIYSLIVSIFALLVIYFCNIGGVRNRIEASPLFSRFQQESLNTGRFEIFQSFFSYWLDYPWGGGFISKKTGSSLHFYWQQFYDFYGILGAIPLSILSIRYVQNIYTLLRLRRNRRINSLLAIMYIVMLLQCCLEPVFTGYPILFWAFSMIHGATNAYLHDCFYNPNSIDTPLED